MATYMNVLSHHNVIVVARFQRSTFAFLPPDHWSSSWEGGPKSGTANWQVMVIEISNKEGRDRYTVLGHENRIAAAGKSFGAKPVNTNSINTRKHHHNKFSPPNKQYVSEDPEIPPEANNVHPPDKHRSDKAHFQHDTQVPGGAEDLY